VVAPVLDRRVESPDDFRVEPDAPRALYAPLLVMNQGRSRDYTLAAMDFFQPHSGGLKIVFHIVFVQSALAHLVADRAIRRVVKEDKLHHTLAGGKDFLIGRFDLHAVAGLGVAGDDHRLAARALYLDKAHAAVARD